MTAQNIAKLRASSKGGSAIEYGLLAGLCSVVAIAAIVGSGKGFKSGFVNASSALTDSFSKAMPSKAGAIEMAGTSAGRKSADWLIGTPDSDYLVIDGQVGIKALESDDTLVGDDKGQSFIGGPGADMIYGGGGNDIFYFNPGDGQDTIDSANSGWSNKLIVNDYKASDLTASRTGDDLVLTNSASGDSIQLKNFATNIASDWIKTYAFSDAYLDMASMRAKSVADQKPSGLVLGTYANDVYPITPADNGFTVGEYGGSDTVDFGDIRMSDVTFENGSDSTLTATLSDGRQFVFTQDFDLYPDGQIETYKFKDGTLDFQHAVWKMDADMQANGFVRGSHQADKYVIAADASAFVVNEMASSATDQIVFPDLNAADVTFTNSSGHLWIRLPSGKRIKFSDALNYNDRSWIESYTFKDKTLTRQEAIDKMDQDSKITSLHVNGSGSADHYRFDAGDPDFGIDEMYSGTDEDTITFYQQRGAFSYTHSGDDLLIYDGTTTLTVLGFYGTDDTKYVEKFIFPYQTLTYAEMLAAYP